MANLHFQLSFHSDRKRQSHKQNRCSASGSVGLIFTSIVSFYGSDYDSDYDSVSGTGTEFCQGYPARSGSLVENRCAKRVLVIKSSFSF